MKWYILGKESSFIFDNNRNTEDNVDEECLLDSVDCLSSEIMKKSNTFEETKFSLIDYNDTELEMLQSELEYDNIQITNESSELLINDNEIKVCIFSLYNLIL